MEGEIASCVRDANNYYTLTFNALPGDGPDEYHALEIKLDKSGLKALTRTGYYAQPWRQAPQPRRQALLHQSRSSRNRRGALSVAPFSVLGQRITGE